MEGMDRIMHARLLEAKFAFELAMWAKEEEFSEYLSRRGVEDASRRLASLATGVCISALEIYDAEGRDELPF